MLIRPSLAQLVLLAPLEPIPRSLDQLERLAPPGQQAILEQLDPPDPPEQPDQMAIPSP